MKERHNIYSMKKSRDFRIKYINILLASWEVPSLFSCFFVYEHAHPTADYRGRDLASLRHRRMGKANSHGYLLLPVCSGKIDKRLEQVMDIVACFATSVRE